MSANSSCYDPVLILIVVQDFNTGHHLQTTDRPKGNYKILNGYNKITDQNAHLDYYGLKFLKILFYMQTLQTSSMTRQFRVETV